MESQPSTPITFEDDVWDDLKRFKLQHPSELPNFSSEELTSLMNVNKCLYSELQDCLDNLMILSLCAYL